MEEIFVETAKDEAAGMDLQYIIICTAPSEAFGEFHCDVYSLLVVKTEGTEGNESVFVYDISRTRERALEISRLLCENTVTPCTVYEVLDDIL
ncbi:MAG: hypothetical protein IKU19_01070 [Clostridia bacterium]|nr:hypothetical protein [Clostridia bacterium]